MIKACLDGSNEYFNGMRWKPISEYLEGEGEEVLQYCMDGTGKLVTPTGCIREENTTPVYESKDGNIPTINTDDMEVVFRDAGKLTKQRFKYFFETKDATWRFSIPNSCEWVDGNESLQFENIFKVAKSLKKQDMKYLRNNEDLLRYVQETSKGVTLTQCFMKTNLTTKKVLLQELNLRKSVVYVPFNCGSNYELADRLWTICQLSGKDRRFYITKHKGGYYLYQPTIYDDGKYSPSDIEISITGEVSYGYLRSDMGDILDRESGMFKYYTGLSTKYGLGVPSGMLVLRRKGTMFVVGCGV